ERVAPAHVALRDAASQNDDTAAFVRRLVGGVCAQLCADRRRDYHQRTASSISSPSQNGADRYFQPPSARTHTTTEPCGSSSATRRVTCTTAPEETPAKMPSRSRRTRTATAAWLFETSSFRSSCETSSTGGTYPSSS